MRGATSTRRPLRVGGGLQHVVRGSYLLCACSAPATGAGRSAARPCAAGPVYGRVRHRGGSDCRGGDDRRAGDGDWHPDCLPEYREQDPEPRQLTMRRAGCGCRLGTYRTSGQVLLEAAIALPVLLLVAIGLVQFAIYYHAQNVVTLAVQDGARLAAAEDRSVAEGVAHAQALLQAGLGRTAREVTVQGSDAGAA